MSNIHVLFAIRLRSHEATAVIGERVEHVLNCSLVAAQHPEYPDEMVMESETACLRVRIMHWPFYADPTLRVYQLRAENIIEPRWDYSDEIDLSKWMLQEFRKRDS